MLTILRGNGEWIKGRWQCGRIIVNMGKHSTRIRHSDLFLVGGVAKVRTHDG